MRKAFIIILTLVGISSFGQDVQLDLIDKKVKSIKSDSTLSVTEYEIEMLPGITTGSKEIRRIWGKNKKVYRIEQEIKYLKYITRISIYLENEIPIKIVEKEEKFNHSKDRLDFSKPIEVFNAIIYVFDWENDESRIIKNGKRVFTEGNCSTFDYDPLIVNAISSFIE